MAKHPPVTVHARRRLFTLAAGLAVGVLAAGCSGQGSAAQTDADAPISIETTPTAIAVQNRAGLPLTDVTVGVLAYGGLEFTRTLTRIENSERRTVLMSDLRSRDGSPFNARLMRAKSVRLRASDAAGKQYEIELPMN
jgi:hypothetical protein